jgi:hypothetical protein
MQTQSLPRKKLPIGIQTFANVRAAQAYADKCRSPRQVQGASLPVTEPVGVTLIGVEFSRNIVAWETFNVT